MISRKQHRHVLPTTRADGLAWLPAPAVYIGVTYILFSNVEILLLEKPNSFHTLTPTPTMPHLVYIFDKHVSSHPADPVLLHTPRSGLFSAKLSILWRSVNKSREKKKSEQRGTFINTHVIASVSASSLSLNLPPTHSGPLVTRRCSLGAGSVLMELQLLSL